MHPDLEPPWTHRPMPRPVALGRTWFSIRVPLYVSNKHMTQLPGDPDAIELPLDADAGALGAYIKHQPVPAALPELSEYRGYTRYVPFTYERSILKKTGSFDAYLKKFDSKARYNLRRTVKKFAEASGPEQPIFKIYEDPAEILGFLDLAVALGKQTYQAKLYGNSIPDDAKFRAELVDLATQQKQLGAMLFYKGKPAAFWWGLRVGTYFVSEYMGFDAELKELSPGTAMQMLFFEHFFARPDLTAIDFGEQDLQYKRHFRTDVQLCSEVFYFRHGARGQALLQLERGLRVMRGVHKPLLEELRRRGWLGKVRRLASKLPGRG